MKVIFMSACTILLWGLNPILTRLCSNIIGIKPYMIVNTIAYNIATLLITTALNKDVWSDVGSQMFTKHDDIAKRWSYAIVDSVMCLAVPFILYNIMLSDTKSVSVVVTTTWYGAPIVTTIISRFIFHEKLNRIQIAGIILSIGGIVMMNAA